MMDLLERLRAPFPPDRVSWRVGSTTSDKKRGMALAYIDARDVMERLDEACGVAGWQKSYPHANGKTVCSIAIKIGDEWIWKSDGAGDTDFEAEKGALSDAFKRAAVNWGIGRYLYDVAAPWVEIEQAGKSFKIKESELPKLRKALGSAPQREATAETSPPEAPGILSAPAIKLRAGMTGCNTERALMTYGDTTMKTDIGNCTMEEAQYLRDFYKKKLTALREAGKEAA